MQALIFLSLIFSARTAWSQVRQQTLKPDQTAIVKTALGIATIVQLPESIQNAIVGDQSGFRIEFLDRAVTIKPLRSSASTNVYLVTEKRRYTLKLKVGAQEGADYIVYLKDDLKPSVNYRAVSLNASSKKFVLSIDRIGESKNGFFILEGSLRSLSNFSHELDPKDVWLLQDKKSKIINGLYISSVKISKDAAIKIGISVSAQDVSVQKPLRIEIRGVVNLSLLVSLRKEGR